MHDTEKPYELTFEERPGYLYVHIKADTMTEEMSASYLSQVADKCAGAGLTRVLIYREVPYIIEPTAIFFSMQNEIKLLKGLKLAVVTPFPTTEDALNFAILVSNNRGADFKLHKTIEAAEEWLETDSMTR
jgi:hypothetical protein